MGGIQRVIAMRTVVLNAMCSKWPEDKTEGVEIWGLNRTFTVEPRLDRLYTFDPEHLFPDGYVKELRDLGVPVYTRTPHPDIPLSRTFPRDEIAAFFHGKVYATSTYAWMIQHAIYEHCNGNPIDKLVMSGAYHPRDSMEYLWALPCVNFWTGVAMGHGMRVQVYGDTAICRAMPWETNDYGYRRNLNGNLCIETLAAAYRACYEYPRRFQTAEQEIAATEDYLGLKTTEQQLTQMLSTVQEQLRVLDHNGVAEEVQQ